MKRHGPIDVGAEKVAEKVAERVGDLPAVTGFANVEGLGVRGTVEGHDVVVGRAALDDLDLHNVESLSLTCRGREKQSSVVVVLVVIVFPLIVVLVGMHRRGLA